METKPDQKDPLEGLRFRVALDTTTICNLRCKQCFHTLYHTRALPYRQHEMPPALFEKILDELDEQIDSLVLSCSAEPFTNSDFGRYLAALRRRQAPYEKWLATNLLLLKESLARDLIETGLTWMVVSIDGARPETYKALRVGGDFDRLLDRLDLVNRLKAEMGAERPFLRFNVILSRLNLEDLPRFVELAAEKRVAEVTFQHLVPFEGLGLKRQTLHYESRRKVAAIFEATRERARQLGVALGELNDLKSPLQSFGDFLADLARRWRKPPASLPLLERIFCYHVWLNLVVNSRGDLFPCFCWINDAPMGNVGRQTFREIWESAPYRQLRDELLGERPLRAHCLDCSRRGRKLLSRSSFREQEITLHEL